MRASVNDQQAECLAHDARLVHSYSDRAVQQLARLQIQ